MKRHTLLFFFSLLLLVLSFVWAWLDSPAAIAIMTAFASGAICFVGIAYWVDDNRRQAKLKRKAEVQT